MNDRRESDPRECCDTTTDCQHLDDCTERPVVEFLGRFQGGGGVGSGESGDTAGITAPRCASLGCDRAGFIKSEAWGAYLCAQHALTGPRRKHAHPCPTKDCPGDGCYVPPGKGHLSTCSWFADLRTPLAGGES